MSKKNGSGGEKKLVNRKNAESSSVDQQINLLDTLFEYHEKRILILESMIAIDLKAKMRLFTFLSFGLAICFGLYFYYKFMSH